MSQLFKLIGSPITLPTIIGFHNLTSLQKEELNWEEDDFADPKAQPFWYFDGSLCFEEQDLQPVRQYFHLLSNSEWNYFLPPCYAVKFNRDNRGMPVEVVIQEVEALELVLPEVLTQEQASQLVEKLACHVYDHPFDVPPATVKQVVEDLIPWSDMTDTDFEKYTGNRELLEELFHRVRNCKDAALRDLLDEFFNQTIDRTL
jgi:hypothetical protein